MEAKSKQIYKFLCDDIVGSERVVKYRRLFFKTYEYAQNKFYSPSKYIITSGSKAEGLDLPGSDLDIMLVSKQHIVHEPIPQFEDKSVDDNILSLNIDYDNAQPGFVLLKLYERPHKDFEDSLILRNEDGYFLSSNLYLQNLASKYPFSRISINGPCLSNISLALDVAHSLKCKKWPTVARKWLFRHRSSGWPSANLITMISKELVLLVPVGSKSDSGESHPLEWRISFSVPEKKLIHTWTHTHMLCYALLKILIKDVLKQNHTISDLLCSYFLKTVMFWLSEEIDATWWTPIHLMDCFVACLGRLTYWILNKYIPNYFIPQHNMIDRYFTQQAWDELLALITFLHGIGWESIFLCDSLKKLAGLKNNSALQEHASRYSEFDKAVIPLFDVFNLYFYDVEYSSAAQASKKCLCHLTRTNLPTKVRILFTTFLFRISHLVRNIVSQIDSRNKQIYWQRKQTKSISLILTQLAGERGWMSLAMNFYLCGQYRKSITVLDHAKCISIRNTSIISSFSNTGNLIQDSLHINNHTGYISNTMRRLICHNKFKMRDFCIFDIQTYDYLLQLFPQQHFILFPTEVLIYYLRFACCHQLQDIYERQQCLHDLTLITETAISDGLLPDVCSTYLFHAHQIAHDRDFEQRVKYEE
ncbi:uncharacterized protein [Mytilus edulis]|uniref:uncharacterized protein n=1 Tax=Mytilus edulis TaxID=6550 RepID=UPI0039EF8B5A